MNNAEKILTTLEQLVAGQTKIEARLTKLEAGQAKLGKDFTEMRKELNDGVWEDIRRLSAQLSRQEADVGILKRSHNIV